MFSDLCVFLCIRITLEALLKDVFYFIKIYSGILISMQLDMTTVYIDYL